MKTKIMVFTAIALLVAATGFATELPRLNIFAADAEKTLVSFETPVSQTLELSFLNSDGTVLYHWKSAKPQNQFNRMFNLKEPGEGSYEICMNYGGQSLSRNIHFTNTGIKVDPVIQLYEPYFCYKNGQIKISFFNVSQKSVYLNMYSKGNFVDGVKLGNQMNIQKCIDISTLKKGDYEIVLTEHFKDHNFTVQR